MGENRNDQHAIGGSPQGSLVEAGLFRATGVVYDAVLSEDRRYRYCLSRSWGRGERMAWIMLNPSTADADVDDPTIRRCRSFAKAWGYGGLEVVNLFAYRATNPAALRLHGEAAIGPDNDAVIVKATFTAGIIIAAWGEKGRLLGRDASVLALLRRFYDGSIYCLGTTV